MSTQDTLSDPMDPADELLASLLAEGWSHRRIASFCDISTKTIQRRLNVEAFAQKVSLLKRQRLSETVSRITRITDKAIGVLEEAMDDEDVKIRMRAARAALDYQERYHRRAVFEADVDHRISTIEEEFNLAGLAREAPVGDPNVNPVGDIQLTAEKRGMPEVDQPQGR